MKDICIFAFSFSLRKYKHRMKTDNTNRIITYQKFTFLCLIDSKHKMKIDEPNIEVKLFGIFTLSDEPKQQLFLLSLRIVYALQKKVTKREIIELCVCVFVRKRPPTSKEMCTLNNAWNYRFSLLTIRTMLFIFTWNNVHFLYRNLSRFTRFDINFSRSFGFRINARCHRLVCQF